MPTVAALPPPPSIDATLALFEGAGTARVEAPPTAALLVERGETVRPAVSGWTAALVPGRDCGACTMCCKLFRIPELDKPPMVLCRHVVQGGGCGIHPTRPEVCRLFFCHYLRNPNLGPEWKPAACGFVLYIEAGGRRMVVASDQAAPNAWRKQPFYAQLKRWATLGAPRNHQILVFNGKRAIALLPDRDEDLGIIEVGDVVAYHLESGRVRVAVSRGQPTP